VHFYFGVFLIAEFILKTEQGVGHLSFFGSFIGFQVKKTSRLEGKPNQENTATATKRNAL
jgi:hypothetical protein